MSDVVDWSGSHLDVLTVEEARAAPGRTFDRSRRAPVVIVNSDETLWLRNTTEEDLRSLCPRFAARRARDWRNATLIDGLAREGRRPTELATLGLGVLVRPILKHMDPGAELIAAGRALLFHWNQLTMVAVIAAALSLPGTAARFVGCLLRQHRATPFATRQLAWLCVVLAATESVRARMMTARLDLWPHQVPALTRGIVSGSRPLPAGAAEARD